jgi:hypothetical protein
VSDDTRDPDLSDLLALHAEQTLNGIRTHLPGTILSYDKNRQSCSVQVLIQDLVIPEEGTDYVPETLAVINDAPVMFCGSGANRITWPVKAGDTCEVHFCSSAISNWAAGGGITNPVDPRRHDLTDAIVWVGLHDFGHVPTDAPDDAIVVHAGAGISIKFGGSDANQSGLLGDSFVSACDTFADAISIELLIGQRKSTKGLMPEWTKEDQRHLEGAREVYTSLTGRAI